MKHLSRAVSLKRRIHSIGVAQVTEMLLAYYRCTDYVRSWNGFGAGFFCGLVHDLARETEDSQLLLYCRENSIVLSEEELSSPVLAHGKVSAHMAEKLFPGYPESWKKAIEVHTTGCAGMDDLATALFAADYLEPSRSFLTDTERREYLKQESLAGCAYAILRSMIAHWEEKGYHGISEKSLEMKRAFGEKFGL